MMRKICCLIMSFLTALTLSLCVSAAGAVPQKVLDATDSVVRILSEFTDGYSTGSGFVIKSDHTETLIVTNYHVVEGEPYSISIWLDQDETISASILVENRQKDLCVLKLSSPVRLEPLRLSSVSAMQGEAVYAVGYPAAADYLSDEEAHAKADATITDGIVSALRETKISEYGSKARILQINAAINPGNSGGPLFNTHGEVVGVNTYGIADTQGIFGAISAEEVYTMLDSFGILQREQPSNRALIWICAITAALIVMTVVVFIALKKKYTAKEKKTTVCLRSFMQEHPNGLNENEAAALLLPVAIQLNKLHQGGRVHLELTPDTVLVGGEGASIQEPTGLETSRYVSGFASPEIYEGISGGSRSDIYSFFAILHYVTTGQIPENALSRSRECDFQDIPEGETAFDAAIRKGMSLNAEDRYSSMEEIVAFLAAHQISVFQQENQTVNEREKTSKETKKFHGKLAVCIVLVALAAVMVIYAGTYTAAVRSAEEREFEKADHLLFLKPVTNLHDKNLTTYIEAGQFLENRKYPEAKENFARLGGYMEAESLLLECDYRYAARLADADNFEKAIELFESLKEKNYKDAETKWLETRYRYAVYIMQEEQDYVMARQLFSELAEGGYEPARKMEKEAQYLRACELADGENFVLAYEAFEKIRDYLDSEEFLDALAEVIYMEGQACYRKGDMIEAERDFECITPYSESEKYLKLINIRGAYYPFSHNAYKIVKELKELFYFENAAELLLDKQDLACEFLRGEWETADGYYYLNMGSDRYMSYNLPWIDYGEYYYIENGITYRYYDGEQSNKRILFRISALTPDCIEVYCAKDGRTYTLYRR